MTLTGLQKWQIYGPVTGFFFQILVTYATCNWPLYSQIYKLKKTKKLAVVF